MEKIMAVYDVDASYAERFADVVNQKAKAPFTVVPFTSIEALREYGEKHDIEILLIGNGVLQGQIEGIKARSVVTLAEGRSSRQTAAIPVCTSTSPQTVWSER